MFRILYKCALVTLIAIVCSLLITGSIMSAFDMHNKMGFVIATICPLTITPPISLMVFRQSERLRVTLLQLSQVMLQLEETNAKLLEKASRDSMTGLLNREAFFTHVDRVRRQVPGSLLIIDADHFKKINDTYGHLAGRMVVGGMGRLILESVRQEDHAGLYGGDEAIILFPNANLEEASEVAETLRAAVESYPFDHHGQAVRVTISQGLAEYPSHGTTPEALIGAADRALYAAKAAGRNCVRTAPYPEV